MRCHKFEETRLNSNYVNTENLFPTSPQPKHCPLKKYVIVFHQKIYVPYRILLDFLHKPLELFSFFHLRS